MPFNGVLGNRQIFIPIVLYRSKLPIPLAQVSQALFFLGIQSPTPCNNGGEIRFQPANPKRSVGAKAVGVEFVDRTTTWARPVGFPSTGVQSEFVQVVKDNINTLQSTTITVAMK
jgi:hypothetical protein